MSYIRLLRVPSDFGVKLAYSSMTAAPKCQHAFSMSTMTMFHWAEPLSPLLSTTRMCAPLASIQSQRNYMRKKTIKMPPTKPLNFDYAGDLQKNLPELNPSLLRPGFEECKELESADETVKKLFTLEFADGHEILQKRLEDITAKVQDHPADVRSIEVKIAQFTVKIRNQMKHAYDFRKDKVGKSQLIRRIQARRKYLKKLMYVDIDKFHFLLKELDLKYIPEKEYNRKISKREARKRAAILAGKEIMKTKMEEFSKKLQEEKKVFEKEKQEELERIRNELQTLGVKETDSLESIFRALNLGGKYELDKKIKKKSRRDQLLEKKFELYANRAKIETPT